MSRRVAHTEILRGGLFAVRRNIIPNNTTVARRKGEALCDLRAGSTIIPAALNVRPVN